MRPTYYILTIIRGEGQYHNKRENGGRHVDVQATESIDIKEVKKNNYILLTLYKRLF